VALLRDIEGLRIPLVASGKRTRFYFTDIHPRMVALGLDDQVRFRRFCNAARAPMPLSALHHCVIPTKFEREVFQCGRPFWRVLPVACSRVTSLPEQAAGAALIFDPDNPREIADAILQIWRDPALRVDMALKGAQRVRNLIGIRRR